MLPTSNPNQGRWIRYRLHSHRESYLSGDPLARREAMQHGGYRMGNSVLKREIKRSLGYKAMRT
jgi:hypothetical protein